MMFNWLDILLLVIIAITVIIGALRGFVRQIIGLLAVILGLILAIKYYPYGKVVFTFLRNEVLAQLFGFFLIFVIVLSVGWVINILLAKAVRGPFKSLNHFMGAGLGLIKGILICVVVVFGFLVFPVNTRILEESILTPYCMEIADTAYDLIPQELKDKFREAYLEIMGNEEEGEDEKRS
jgi:membrane protein required for colicin V production